MKHCAFNLPAIERAKKEITVKGIDLYKDITDGKTGIKHFFVQDPDGTFVEIVEDSRDLDTYIVQSNNHNTQNTRSHLKLIP